MESDECTSSQKPMMGIFGIAARADVAIGNGGLPYQVPQKVALTTSSGNGGCCRSLFSGLHL